MIIDAHQHFWRLSRGDYGWLTPDLAPLYRDFEPQDLAPLLNAEGIDGTVLVQAAPTRAETEFMLSLASENSFIKGVVGWVDFAAPDAAEVISALSQNPALVGLRPMIQDIPDPDWMLQTAISPALEAMIDAGLTFDALTLPRHLPNLLTLCKTHPDLTVVIDHGSKPGIAEGNFDGWAKDMSALAHETQCYCKISGLVTEAAADWTPADLRPYTDFLLKEFGAKRLIWGSDWPVLTLAAQYGTWLEVTKSLFEGLSDKDSAALFGGTAIKAYGLNV